MRRRTFAGFMGLALGLAGVAEAAKPVQPPLTGMVTGNDGTNQIAVVEAEAPDGALRFRFKALRVLQGAAFARESVKLDAAAAAAVKPGARYVLVFSRFRRNPLLRDVKEENPEGAVARGFPEVKSGLFALSPVVEALFAAELRREADMGLRLALILEALDGRDERTRILASQELMLRAPLLAAPGDAAFERFRRQAADTGLPVLVRDYLLQACANLPPSRQGPWQAAIARELLKTRGTQFDLASHLPSVMISAARFLERQGGPEDRPALKALLRSNAPGVAKAALAALDHQDPAETRAFATSLAQDPALHGETRRALTRYLKAAPQAN